jgi:hypothetical protein
MPDQSMINREGEGRREGFGRVQHRAGEGTFIGKGGDHEWARKSSGPQIMLWREPARV